MSNILGNSRLVSTKKVSNESFLFWKSKQIILKYSQKIHLCDFNFFLKSLVVNHIRCSILSTEVSNERK